MKLINGNLKLIGQWVMIIFVIAGSFIATWIANDRRVTRVEDSIHAQAVLSEHRFNQRMLGYMIVINTFKSDFEKIDKRMTRIEDTLYRIDH